MKYWVELKDKANADSYRKIADCLIYVFILKLLFKVKIVYVFYYEDLSFYFHYSVV